VTTRELLLSAWDVGVVVPVACILVLTAYAARYRGRLSWRAGLFALAVTLLFVALASPIGVLARGYLFSAHMLQHLLLTLAIPPLVLMALPREDDAGEAPEPSSGLSVGSWALGVGAMWLWHARALCNAAAEHPTVQGVQTLSLVLMGLAFWRPILSPYRSRRMEPLTAVAYLFAACVACTILGVIVTLSPVEVCSAYVAPADLLGVMPLLREGWGLNCRADQELGGLMMWVPTCFVYAAAILGTLGSYYAGERSGPARADDQIGELR
jgi:putative membrane protein